MSIELYLSTYFDEICIDCHITLCLKCLGFFFSYSMFFLLLSALNNLLNTGFVTKHGLIHQVSDHICILENCECGFYDRLLSLYQYIVLTLNLILTESTLDKIGRAHV